MKNKTKVLTLTAMFCALAFAMTAVIRIPVVLFLKYDPKDIIITLCGFILGPLSAIIVSVITSLIEMVTISDTGPIGCVMNIISSCSFAFTAALVYKKKKTLSGAAIGLLLGCVAMTAVMLIWNYCVTPLYMGYPREAVAELLLPAFLPFNLIKSGLNAAFAFLLYKPLVGALRKTHLIPESTSEKTKTNIPMIIISALIIVTCVLVILSMNKII
ncbi:MAG: energy coupling factor transporter S component ThiW [Eubacterium sp.]|nr:energy coupling factor transporter S component ThiW [Eubacterium sp.]MDE6155757.1 energy coupling factor transporter S component ThiW [Eubacterium sp.]